MSCKRSCHPVCLLWVLFAFLVQPLWGQGTGRGKTADEIYIAAVTAYNKGQFEEAVAGFNKYIADYGASEQAREVIAQLRYPLAMSLLHLQQFDDALPAVEAALGTEPPPIPAQKETLLFWKAVCLMQQEDYEAAREAFVKFQSEFPKGEKAGEAILLHAVAYLLQDKFEEAASQLGQVKGRLSPIDRGRASVLELYALIESGQKNKALDLVVEEFPRIDQMLQIATFQTLVLQLGSSFLEDKQYRKAILCLQRVWSRDRLLTHQEKRLADLEDALAAAEAQPASDAYRKFQLRQIIAKVRRELQNFQKIENFDSALRLRLATAFQAMRRYREAALIMEEMLTEMPPDPVVEAATVNLVQSWSAIERWDKAITAAELFEKKFPKSAKLPMVLYLKGIAEQRDNRQPAAIATFSDILKKYPDSEFVPRALFMKGFSQLLAEQNPEAIATFDEFAAKYGNHEFADAAAYWRGMGFSFDKQHDRSREAMAAYLKKYPEGACRGLATFRIAYADQSLLRYPESIRELLDYLREYPGHESNNEALLLLGDAYMAEGEIDYGIAAFKRIPPEDTKFFEEGWFKIGKALRLQEKPGEMRAHFEQFCAEHPRSPRAAEAIYWIGWTYRQAGDNDKAREVYWEAITSMGNDPSIRSVDELFPALSKLYKSPEEQTQYLARLRDLREEADASDKKTLAMRSLWAQAQVLAAKNGPAADGLMLAAADRAEVSSTNPMLLANFAETLQAHGQADRAEQMWRDLIKWNPRASQKAQAFFALANLELSRGNEPAALAWMDRFEHETGGSLLLSRVLLAKADILAKRGQFDASRAALERLLASEYASGPDKVAALYTIGDLYMQQGKPELAIPYFQRIYILYGRWSDWVAKAYFRSGEAFEKINDPESARKTYDEMTKVEAIRACPEMEKARKRLEALGGAVKS